MASICSRSEPVCHCAKWHKNNAEFWPPLSQDDITPRCSAGCKFQPTPAARCVALFHSPIDEFDLLNERFFRINTYVTKCFYCYCFSSAHAHYLKLIGDFFFIIFNLLWLDAAYVCMLKCRWMWSWASIAPVAASLANECVNSYLSWWGRV